MHDAIYSGEGDFYEYERRVVAYVCAPNDGLITIVKDRTYSDLWWIDGHLNGYAPRPKRVRELCRQLGIMGARHLATDTSRAPKMRAYWRAVGFECLRDDLWGLNVEPDRVSTAVGL